MPDPEAAAARKARIDATRARKLSAMAKPQRTMRIGLGALAGIGAIAAGGGAVRNYLRKQQEESALIDFMNATRQNELARMSEESRARSYETAIQQNINNVMQHAPELYSAVVAGRKLPQGAVVLGGEPRVDLLQELGRSMAEGQFRR